MPTLNGFRLPRFILLVQDLKILTTSFVNDL
jgi:hypothetical protein